MAAIGEAVLPKHKTIEHGHFVAQAEQGGSQDRADATGAAGDQYFHDKIGR
jgi:hypothetical protein